MNKMLKRIIVAAFVVPVVVFLIFAKSPWFYMAIAFAALIMALNEIYSMLEVKKMKAYRVIGNIFISAVLLSAAFGLKDSYIIAAAALFILAVLTAVIAEKNVQSINRFFYTAAPAMYITFLGVFGVKLRLLENGSYFIFMLLFMTIICDAGAYFVGSAIGKRKLIPEISPAKTVEGAAGGVAVSVIATVVIYYTLLPKDILGPHTFVHLIVLALLMSVIGQAGDIAASVFKRYTGVKNSSNLLPEHGGALDKIDSSMFTAPILYLYAVYVAPFFG